MKHVLCNRTWRHATLHGFSRWVPAVDDHGAGLGVFSLFSVDLCEEAEDSARLLGDAVVRPAEVLVVPNGTGELGLGIKQRRKSEYIKKLKINSHICADVKGLKVESSFLLLLLPLLVDYRCYSTIIINIISFFMCYVTRIMKYIIWCTLAKSW